jgi:alpha-tubulin suppressor-like RCC1 family protein
MPCNWYHVVVLNGNGNSFFTAGKNNCGQLGTGDVKSRQNVVEVNLPVNLLSICGGGTHNIALAEDRSLWAWGSNTAGQSGFPEEIKIMTVPCQIPNTTNFVQVAAGWEFSLALDIEGNVWGFGSNEFGQLGQDKKILKCITPTRVEDLTNVKMITAGDAFGIALNNQGELWSFGNNYYSSLGVGDRLHRFVPSKVEIDVDEPDFQFTQVSSGSNHTIALDSNSRVWGFGLNSNSQLGVVPRTQDKPVMICLKTVHGFENMEPDFVDQIFNSIVHVDCAGDSSYLTDAEQRVWVFGAKYNMQFGHTASPALHHDLIGKEFIVGKYQLLIVEEGCISIYHGSHYDKCLQKELPRRGTHYVPVLPKCAVVNKTKRALRPDPNLQKSEIESEPPIDNASNSSVPPKSNPQCNIQ